jgi:hypothetical protein
VNQNHSQLHSFSQGLNKKRERNTHSPPIGGNKSPESWSVPKLHCSQRINASHTSCLLLKTYFAFFHGSRFLMSYFILFLHFHFSYNMLSFDLIYFFKHLTVYQILWLVLGWQNQIHFVLNTCRGTHSQSTLSTNKSFR